MVPALLASGFEDTETHGCAKPGGYVASVRQVGFASGRYIESLLYQVKATDPAVVGIPAFSLIAAAAVAAFPRLIRAARIEPARVLGLD